MNWLRYAFPAALLLAVGGLFVAFQRPPVQAQTPEGGVFSRPMKWDYKVIAITPINNVEMELKLQAAGATGWDWIDTQITTSGGTTSVYLIMKKPR
jgi:hypothetical protein